MNRSDTRPCAISRARFRLLCGSAAFATTIVALGLADVRAQTTSPGASESLPTVNVRGAKKRAAKKPQRPVRATRVARPVRPAAPPPVPPPLPTASRERGNGPVVGVVARQSVTATKTDTPLVETPQSISVVTKDQIAAQGATTVTQALNYAPGLSLNTYGANSLFDTITVRGFQAPLFLDGLRLPVDSATTFVTPRIVPYGLERIEVLRGPSSGLYGQTPPGGLVNMISKRPTETPQHEVLFQTGSFNRLEGAIDTSGPIDSNGQWLYRFVGLGRLADTQIENVEDNQYYVAPSLTWRPNLDTSFTILASAQSYGGRGYQQYVPAQGSLLPNPNGRIPYSRNLGEPGFDRILLDQRQIGYALEHRFNDILQFRQNVRYTDISLKGQALREEGLLPDLRTVPRSALFLFGNVNSIAIDNHFQADFATGPFTHKVLLGMDYMRTKSDSGFNFAAGTPLDIFAPVYGAAQPNFNAAIPLVHSRTDLQQLGFYAQDQIRYGGWILSLTGRADHAVNTTSDLLGRTTSDQTDTATTGRAALGYLFDNGVAPYVSYSTSFEPTAGLDAQRNPFKPTTGQSAEIGVKYQPTWFKGLFTAALFDTTRQNVLTTDLGNPLFSIQTGEVNVKGFELEARASLTDRLEIIAGYSRIVPRVTESNTGNVGKIMPNISLETASAWAMYTMHDGPLAGWGIGAGVRHVGKSYANDQNTLTVTPYTLFDATVTYDFAYLRPDLRGLKLQVSVTNLADTYYVANCFDLTYCGLGSGRTVLASLKYQWGAGANTAAAPVRPVASLN